MRYNKKTKKSILVSKKKNTTIKCRNKLRSKSSKFGGTVTTRYEKRNSAQIPIQKQPLRRQQYRTRKVTTTPRKVTTTPRKVTTTPRKVTTTPIVLPTKKFKPPKSLSMIINKAKQAYGNNWETSKGSNIPKGMKFITSNGMPDRFAYVTHKEDKTSLPCPISHKHPILCRHPNQHPGAPGTPFPDSAIREIIQTKPKFHRGFHKV